MSGRLGSMPWSAQRPIHAGQKPHLRGLHTTSDQTLLNNKLLWCQTILRKPGLKIKSHATLGVWRIGHAQHNILRCP
jgi:hypothetical protein